MDDTIYRQAAIDAIEHITSSMSVCVNTDECHGMKRMQRQAVIELANLLSAQPEQVIYASMSDKEFEKWLSEHGICNPNVHESIPCDAVPLLIDNAISELPSAQPELRWIPCSERLPEESGRYLVTRGLNACGALWNRVYIINYSDLMGLKSERIWWDGNVGKSDFKRIDDVTAWMPLPKPWKGEKE